MKLDKFLESIEAAKNWRPPGIEDSNPNIQAKDLDVFFIERGGQRVDITGVRMGIKFGLCQLEIQSDFEIPEKYK